MKCSCLVAPLVLLVAPQLAQAQSASISEGDLNQRVALLKSLPANSDRLCVGISAVAETLLESPAESQLKMPLEVFAQKIYSNLTANEQLPVPASVSIAEQSRPITSPATLKLLVDKVFTFYKRDFQRAIQTEAGIARILNAEQTWISSLAELKQLLATDANHIEFVCCIGERHFPDGTVKVSNHAVLLEALPHEMFVVYDPNAPGQAIECQVSEHPEGVTLTWTCMYRDTSQTTTQTYHVVNKVDYFKAVRK